MTAFPADEVRSKRLAMGKTTRQVADETGLSPSTVNRAERGHALTWEAGQTLLLYYGIVPDMSERLQAEGLHCLACRANYAWNTGRLVGLAEILLFKLQNACYLFDEGDIFREEWQGVITRARKALAEFQPGARPAKGQAVSPSDQPPEG